MSRRAYEDWLRGKTEGPKLWLGGLDPGEYYAIRRLRSGLSCVALGAKIGVTGRMVRSMEKGDRNLIRLREYWGC